MWLINIGKFHKVCKNEATATAWGNYFIRQGYNWSIHNIYIAPCNPDGTRR